MTDFIIKKLPCDLSSHAGLAFVGKYLRRININSLVDPAFPVRSGVANGEILKSYLGFIIHMTKRWQNWKLMHN